MSISRSPLRVARAALLPLTLLVLAPLSSACGDDGGDDATEDTAVAVDTAAPDTAEEADTASPVDTVAPADTAVAVDTAADTSDDAADTTPSGPTPVCVAIRGNGELITAHFAALSRIAELFGPFEGVAGGSSASITSFLTESMHMHPGLSTCGGAECSREEAGARLGLLYKSLFGYLGAMGDRDEAVAVTAILGVIEYAKSEGIGDLIFDGKIGEAWVALLQILESEDVKDLVNPEVITLLKETTDRGKHLRDIWDGMTALGAFDASDPVIFLRPGIIHFAGLADKLGRIGSFYAGYGAYEAEAWEAFFDACALPGRGKVWAEVEALDTGDGTTCGAAFRAILDPWRADFIPQEATADNRIRDRVGQHLRALVITAVLTGQAESIFDAAHQSYVQAADWDLSGIAFDDVKVGYWGKAVDAAPAANDALGFGDLKSSKGLTLGQATWLEALSLSPAEPGLSRGLDISTGFVSVGGWPDLHPVLALRNAGCERVVYLTRRGPDSRFGQEIAGHMGATEADKAAYYDLTNPDSSFSRAISEAAGVWCTDWDSVPFTDLTAITADAYNAPFEVHDATLTPVAGPYAGTTTDAHLPGCTPGVAPPATDE